MIKEIGSEFWDIPLQDKENDFFDEKTRWFISGRSAIDHVIKDIQYKKTVKTALLPSWCCDSMIEPFIRNGINVSFYPVVIENDKLVKKISNNADILLNMNYFGYHVDHDVVFDGIIIDDITQSIFNAERIDSDYMIGSLRKWAGFINGGFAYSKYGFSIEKTTEPNSEYVALRKKAMIEKEKYILGKNTDKEYLTIYRTSEELLDKKYKYSAGAEDLYNVKYLNIDLIKTRRKRNARKLLEFLSDMAIYKDVKDDECPLFVPIIVPDNKRNELKNYLIASNIFCPIHWPVSGFHVLNKQEKFIYDNELSLICDQRYDFEEMEKLASTIMCFMRSEC